MQSHKGDLQKSDIVIIMVLLLLSLLMVVFALLGGGHQTAQPGKSVEGNSVIAVVSIVLSLLALIISTLLTIQQVRLSRHKNALPVLIDMFKEFRSPEFRRNRTYIRTSLRGEFDPTTTGLSKLPEPAATNVLEVCHFFDNLSVLVATGFLDERLVLSYMGGTIEDLWSVLEPYIQREREFRRGPYQEFFEDLAVRAHAQPAAEVRRKLGLRKMSGNKREE